MNWTSVAISQEHVVQQQPVGERAIPARLWFEMKQAGAVTFGQDEKSSLIYGMPRAAFERGAVGRQVPLDKMAASILSACSDGAGKPDATAEAGRKTVSR